MKSSNFFGSGSPDENHGYAVRRVNGTYTQLDSDGRAVDVGALPRDYPCENHRKLKGEARCLGCGRTKNEIRLDGD